MAEARIDGENGRSLVLALTEGQDGETWWGFQATLSFEAGTVSTKVADYGEGLVSFVDDLADAWTGFDGVREYAALEGQLELRCEHDGKGQVACLVRLGQPWPPEWSVEAELVIGAGAHLAQIAADVRALVEASRAV